MKNIIVSLFAILLFAACANNQKRVVVMSKGAAEFDEATKTIKAKDGTGHEEKLVSFTDASVSLQLDAPAGKTSIELKEKGLYILNVKNDTIIGSYQNYTAPASQKNIMTQDDLKLKIDSLQQLTTGKNISTANRNFFILPNQAVKITENVDAIIVGPYHQMRSAEKVDGKDPEVYRFYSIREIRETIGKLEVLTKPVAPPTK
jgi:hypothetical protein